MYEEIKGLVASASKIVIVQADNPDADSLGSSLALEGILGKLGKQISLYCGVEMPAYLRYLSGWDRVEHELPKDFDLSIIVDASSLTLLEKLAEHRSLGILRKRNCVVLDHHAVVNNPVEFTTATLNDENSSSTGELIYSLVKKLDWPLDAEDGEFIMSAILGDTQGLTNDLASASTYSAMAELTTLGVKRPDLEEKRREYSKMPLEIYKYKANLIHNTEFASKNQIAFVVIRQSDINKYSPQYNPVALIQPDFMQISGVQLGIVFKVYDDGRVTGALRTNPGYPIAAALAEEFGGGGHPGASGFKVINCPNFDKLKNEVLKVAEELLNPDENKQ